jgi:hypothetical protein
VTLIINLSMKCVKITKKKISPNISILLIHLIVLCQLLNILQPRMLNHLFERYPLVSEGYHLVYQVLCVLGDIVPMRVFQHNVTLTGLLNNLLQEAREEGQGAA